ncbi:MAG: M20/M25/M40 family metallo-hydrolase [Sphingomonadaceae bacterium]
MIRRSLALLLAFAALLGALALKGELLALPDARHAPAAGEFDTGRALARLARILGDERPHPVDSQANDAVRERLVAELVAIGLKPRVSGGIACEGSAEERKMACAYVRNVFATIGPEAGDHVLVNAHYDSSPAGPGGADDGIGIAAMLEIAELLKDAPLERPVTLLFNDGEEVGLLGARAFLDRNPIAAEVAALVNLEARGVEGPATMFETSRPNGPAIARFARAAERPVANSLATDFYRMLPNSTDVAIFEERDWTILNFAIIGNETRYHTAGDDLAALDPASVRHMGDQALALVRDFAAAPPPPTEGEMIFTDVASRAFIALPAWTGPPAIALGLAALAYAAWRRRGEMPKAMAAVLIALTGAALIVLCGQTIVGSLRAGEYWRGHPEIVSLAILFSSFAAAVAALAWRGASPGGLRPAFWIVFLLLGAAATAAAPGAAILFLLPPAPYLAGLLTSPAAKWLETAGALAAAALLYLLWAPLLFMLEELLSFDHGWIFAPLAAIVLLPALIELKPLVERAPPAVSLGPAAALTIGGWIAVALVPAYSQDRKQAFGIEYFAEEEKEEGRWLVLNDGAPLPSGYAGIGPFRAGVEVPHSSRPRWAAPAPPGLAEAPRLKLISERAQGAARWLEFRIEAPRADTVLVRLPPDAKIGAMRVESYLQAFGDGADEDYLFRCHGRACDGLELAVLAETRTPLEAEIVGIAHRLPAEADPLVERRPRRATPQYSPDASVALRRLRF